ncbi:MAG: hypothetical protein HY996_09480 [Micrococcales bacterium]|nr:hypothetical protein [Micrococcales bacterium]
MSGLNLYGNHRGGTSIVRALPEAVVRGYSDRFILADPQEDRAARLAREVEERFPFVRPTALRVTGQQALSSAGEDDTLVIAMDTVTDTRETLRLRGRRRASFQIVGRGPGGYGGVRLALQGTLLPGDHETEGGVDLLLSTLLATSRSASSRELTIDPLAAATLRPLRELATRQTVRHLAERDRDPSDLSLGPLSLAFGPTAYPLVTATSDAGDRHGHRRDLALGLAARVRRPADREAARGFAVVAVVVPEADLIQFFTIRRSAAGRLSVAAVTELSPPPPRVAASPAVFTD